MTDNLTDEQRRQAMRRVKNKNTSPELFVRALLRKMGHSGYRLHRAEIPGKPDIVWIGRKRAIFINGCFWHGHSCHRGARIPKTHVEYWQNKIERTRQRDLDCIAKLLVDGWAVLTLWECQLGDEDYLMKKLSGFLG